MRKATIIAIMLLLLCSTGVVAYEWSMEPRLMYMLVSPMSDQWDTLYGDAMLNGGGFALDFDFGYGLGPYLAAQGVSAKSTYLEEIDLHFYSSSFVLGLQYRYMLRDWGGPGGRLAMLYTASNETISDDVFEYKMEHSAVGAEAAVEWTFFPFVKLKPWAHGWGIGLQAIYQYRPLDDMGDLEDTSGFGMMISFQYRIDIGKRKRLNEEKKKEDSIKAVTPPPPPPEDKPIDEKPPEKPEDKVAPPEKPEEPKDPPDEEKRPEGDAG